MVFRPRRRQRRRAAGIPDARRGMANRFRRPALRFQSSSRHVMVRERRHAGRVTSDARRFPLDHTDRRIPGDWPAGRLEWSGRRPGPERRRGHGRYRLVCRRLENGHARIAGAREGLSWRLESRRHYKPGRRLPAPPGAARRRRRRPRLQPAGGRSGAERVATTFVGVLLLCLYPIRYNIIFRAS